MGDTVESNSRIAHLVSPVKPYAFMKEPSVPSVPPQDGALSVRQRRILRAVSFFILLSVPLLTRFTHIRLGELIGEDLALFGFWSSIVVAGFGCGLIVAKLKRRNSAS